MYISPNETIYIIQGCSLYYEKKFLKLAGMMLLMCYKPKITIIPILCVQISKMKSR